MSILNYLFNLNFRRRRDILQFHFKITSCIDGNVYLEMMTIFIQTLNLFLSNLFNREYKTAWEEECWLLNTLNITSCKIILTLLITGLFRRIILALSPILYLANCTTLLHIMDNLGSSFYGTSMSHLIWSVDTRLRYIDDNKNILRKYLPKVHL